MNLRDLLLLYGLVGVACAIAVVLRGPRSPRTLASAAATAALWPIWAPFSLGPVERASPREAPGGAAVARIERALGEAVEAVAGTSLEEVFPRATAAKIRTGVLRSAARLDELRALQARVGVSPEASQQKLRDLEARGATARAIDTARRHHESLLRVARLLAADTEALSELADLLEALRTQLLLARCEGSATTEAGAIVSDLRARLDGLVSAFEGEPGAVARA